MEELNNIEDILRNAVMNDLRTGVKSLSQHIYNTIENGAFEDREKAIDFVMNPDNDNSLMKWLIIHERYEDAHFLKVEFEKIIIKKKEP